MMSCRHFRFFQQHFSTTTFIVPEVIIAVDIWLGKESDRFPMGEEDTDMEFSFITFPGSQLA